MKKLLCCLLALCLMAPAMALAEGSAVHAIESKTMNFYFNDTEDFAPYYDREGLVEAINALR